MKKIKMALLPIMLVASTATADNFHSDVNFSQQEQTTVSQDRYASISHDDISNERNSKDPLKELKLEAVNGDVESQYVLGLLYYFGQNDLKVDKVKSAYWMGKAADQGHHDAQFYSGKMHHEGDGVERNMENAFDRYVESAEQGNSDAQFTLGHMYVVGDGVEVNYEIAAYWFEKAAMQGNAAAQNNLGLMYERGDGVPEDHKMAVYWYEQAAANGSLKAQKKLIKINNRNKTNSSQNDNLDILENPDHPFWKTTDGQTILRTPGALETFTRIMEKQELAGVSSDDPFWETSEGKEILSTPGALEEYYDFIIKSNDRQSER